MEHAKIAIIGAGAVGATTTYALLLRNIGTEITLIDIDEKRCEGEILDLSDALSFSRTSKLKKGTLADAKKSNIIIICAGARQKPGQKREELIEINKNIITSIAKNIQPISPNTIVIMVTNPVDIMTYFAQKEFNLPKEQVFGTGTFLDTQRIRRCIAKTLQIADQSVHAYMVGEHGDTQFAAWSSASVAGRPLLDFPQINKNILDQFLLSTRKKAYDIIECKGATFFGIATCVSAICENILFDRRYVMPLSTYIKAFDVCMSIPVVLGAKGIERIIESPFDQSEKKLFTTSGEKLKGIINNI